MSDAVSPSQMTPQQAAREAGLRYCSDEEPGIRRRRCGRGFTYRDADGNTIRDQDVRARIEELAIPPAWTDVWISPNARGHLQATGRDDRGRKQYIYHPRWREVRDQAKFRRMAAFGRALPRIRQRVDEDLRRTGIPREKVLAAVVYLLDSTGLRVGNRQYERDNGTFGLVTLRRRHLEIDGATVRISLRGKGGKEIEATVEDRRLARVLAACDEVRGYELFRYLDDDGEPRDVDAGDVNDYIQDLGEQEFTAKDFRTWRASVRALEELRCAHRDDPEGDPQAHVLTAIDRVAEELHNTRAVCRDAYVHPGIPAAHRDGWLIAALDKLPAGSEAARRLDAEEAALLGILERMQDRDAAA